MNDEKQEIRVLNVMCYKDKQTEALKTRIGFIFTGKEQLVNGPKFKGFSELSCYYDGNLIDRIPIDLICSPVTATLQTRSNPSNPMKSSKIIKDIEYKNNVYSLL